MTADITRDHTAVALLYTAWLIVAWIGAWSVFRSLEPHVAALRSDAGQFVYWTALKTGIGIVPVLLLLRWMGRRIGRVLLCEGRLRTALAWGSSGGLLLALAALVPRVVGHRAITSSRGAWAETNAVVVAPIVEELAFRGAVLALLETGRPPFIANTLTYLLFVASHVPGWLFQGRLVEMMTRSIGGAVGIFVVGWILGLIAQRSGSVAASMVGHGINNLCA